MIDTALGPRSAGPCFGGWQPSCYLKEDQPLNVTICSKLSLIGVVTFGITPALKLLCISVVRHFSLHEVEAYY